jgi:hypothetical protein
MSEFLKDQSIPIDLDDDGGIIEPRANTFLSHPEYRQAMLTLLALADEPIPAVGDCLGIIIEISAAAFVLDLTVNQVAEWGS